MSDYLTGGQAQKYVQHIRRAIPGAEAEPYRLNHYLVDVLLPNGKRVTIRGESGDIEGDIADLKALAEGREP